MTAPDGTGQAHDAAASTGPGPDRTLVAYQRAVVDEYTRALEGARAKVILLEQHLAGAHQSVAEAEADLEQAQARLAEVN